MGSLLYILDENKKPVPVKDTRQWAEWMKNLERRRVQVDKVLLEEVGFFVTISTVFLGMDYGYLEAKPLLFETMVFQGDDVDSLQRYYTWEQALKGHDTMVRKIKDKFWVKRILDSLSRKTTFSIENSEVIIKKLVSSLKEENSN